MYVVVRMSNVRLMYSFDTSSKCLYNANCVIYIRTNQVNCLAHQPCCASQTVYGNIVFEVFYKFVILAQFFYQGCTYNVRGINLPRISLTVCITRATQTAYRSNKRTFPYIFLGFKEALRQTYNTQCQPSREC